jgi:glutamate dehydrogenase (NAD(P)+)
MPLSARQDCNQLVCTVKQASQIIGYVVIDSTVGGRARGGLRMLPDVDEDEIRGLARAMTLKYGFVGLAEGGAKAGLRGDPEVPPEQRRRQLVEFGQAIGPLLQSRAYIPGADMGTTPEDIRYMLQAVGVPIKRRQLRPTKSGYHTALTVFAGATQAARHLGLVLNECTAAIEGFGKVGSELAALLAQAGVRVVAVSTLRGAIYNPHGLDVARLRQLTAESDSHAVELYRDAERIDRAALLELPVDVLCPCARHNSLHAGNAPRIAARIISPGANNPITPEAERILFERGVLCLPDFVTNCGGVLGGALEFASIRQEQIAAFIDRRVGARIQWLLDTASRTRVLPRAVAEPFARERIRQMRQRAARPSPQSRILKVGLDLYRRGLVPGQLVAALALPYFEKTLA